MSGPGIEPQSWGGKTLAVVEISTDYYFGGGPHLNAKKKVHSSLQSQKKPFEATSHESQRQWCEGQVFIWRGLWKKRWSKKCGHKDGMEVVSCRWIDMHHFFSWSGQGHWVVEGSYRETNSKEASTKGEDDWCWRLKSETEAREWGERGMSNGTRRMGQLQVKNS